MAVNRDKVRWEWVMSWLFPVLAAATAFIAPFLWDAAKSDDDGMLASPFLYVGALLAAAAIILTVVQGSAATASVRDTRNKIRDYNHRLVDTIKVLGDLPDAKNGAEARHEFLKTVTREAKSIMMIDGLRICVYELDARDNDQDSDFLRLIACAGRADSPRPEFTTDTPFGKDAVMNAMGSAARCYDKLDRDDFLVDRDPNAPWKSFIAVPLHVDNRARGLMTIDTTLDMKFTSDHIAIAMTIGRFIEIGLKTSFSAAVETAPEVQNARAKLETIRAQSAEPRGTLQVWSRDQEGR